MIIATEQRRARIKHTCHDCAGVIRPGEVYTRNLYAYDGRRYSLRRCDACDYWLAHLNPRDLPDHDDRSEGWLVEFLS